MSVGADIAIGVLVLVGLVVLAALRGMINIVQQGQVGVVKRLGEYRRTHEPGLVVIAPFVDSLQDVDMREIPRPGDRQEVITKDNVVVTVNATIFTQVVDAKQALFSVANFDIAIDALARTALRSVIGTLSLDEALSDRERINTDVQQQMEVVTDKWGIRISRIEIVEIAPPPQILQALALQKQADQEKRAKILQSEGLQQSAINVAEGDAQAAIKAAEGERQAAILRAQGNRQAAILEAEGRAQAIETVYTAITRANPDPTLVAILQLDTLAKFAESDDVHGRRALRERRSARRRPGPPQRPRRRPVRRRPAVLLSPTVPPDLIPAGRRHRTPAGHGQLRRLQRRRARRRHRAVARGRPRRGLPPQRRGGVCAGQAVSAMPPGRKRSCRRRSCGCGRNRRSSTRTGARSGRTCSPAPTAGRSTFCGRSRRGTDARSARRS